jgi:hypothetical protein
MYGKFVEDLRKKDASSLLRERVDMVWYYALCKYMLQKPVTTQNGGTSLLTAECLYIAIKSE